MRRMKSFITKLLLLLIALTMLFTGINQVFTHNSDVIAEVGKKSIAIDDYQRLYHQEKINLQNLFGASLSEEQFESFGMKRMVLDRLVQDQLLSNLIDEMGLKIGDDSVIAAIKTVPDFQGQDGKFSKDKFLSILNGNNVDEQQYITSLKEVLIKELILKFLQRSTISYAKIAELLYNYRYEQRLVTLKTLLPTMVKGLPKATEEELLSFYEKNKQNFWSPEYRKAQYFVISKDQVDSNVSISDDDVLTQLQTLEKRWNIGYFVSPDAKAAEKLYDEIIKVNQRPSDMSGYKKMDNITVNMLPEELQDIFKLSEGDISQPKKVNSNFYIFYIDKKYKISDEEKKMLTESIRQNLINEAINNRLEELIISMEEKLSSGITIEDLTKMYNIKIEEIGPLDIANAPKGQRYLVESIFHDENNNTFVEMNTDSDVSEYYYIHLLEIIKSKLQQFNDCRKQVEDLWEADLKTKKLYDLATDDSIKFKGQKETIFRASVANVEAPKQDYPASFVSEIFSLKLNESTKPIEYKDGKVIIAKLEEIKPAIQNEILVQQIEDEIKKKITESMYIELKDYLYKKFPVKINEKLLQ